MAPGARSCAVACRPLPMTGHCRGEVV